MPSKCKYSLHSTTQKLDLRKLRVGKDLAGRHLEPAAQQMLKPRGALQNPLHIQHNQFNEGRVRGSDADWVSEGKQQGIALQFEDNHDKDGMLGSSLADPVAEGVQQDADVAATVITSPFFKNVKVCRVDGQGTFSFVLAFFFLLAFSFVVWRFLLTCVHVLFLLR
jgi:hypothetical protein